MPNYTTLLPEPRKPRYTTGPEGLREFEFDNFSSSYSPPFVSLIRDHENTLAYDNGKIIQIFAVPVDKYGRISSWKDWEDAKDRGALYFDPLDLDTYSGPRRMYSLPDLRGRGWCPKRGKTVRYAPMREVLEPNEACIVIDLSTPWRIYFIRLIDFGPEYSDREIIKLCRGLFTLSDPHKHRITNAERKAQITETLRGLR